MRRLPMRKIRDALRLRAGGLTMREIGLSLGLGRSTASEYLNRHSAPSVSIAAAFSKTLNFQVSRIQAHQSLDYASRH